MRHRLDGAWEASRHDAELWSACGRTADATDGDDTQNLQHATRLVAVQQTNADYAIVGLPHAARAAYLTDADGSLVAFARLLNGSDALSTPTLTVDDDTVETVTPHACAPGFHVAGSRVASWRAALAAFDYESAGGVMAPSGWDEERLRAAAPVASLVGEWSADGAKAHVRAEHELFSPLLYVKCVPLGQVLALERFIQSEFAAAAPLDFVVPSTCTRLRACAALPAGPVGCGGTPEQCTELDLVPNITAALEREHPPMNATRLAVSAQRRSDGSLHVDAGRCEDGSPARATYARVNSTRGPVIGYSTEPQLTLGPLRGALSFGSLHVYRVCDGGSVVSTTTLRLEQLRWRRPPTAHPAAQQHASTVGLRFAAARAPAVSVANATQRATSVVAVGGLTPVQSLFVTSLGGTVAVASLLLLLAHAWTRRRHLKLYRSLVELGTPAA